jgi:hypothetical protein
MSQKISCPSCGTAIDVNDILSHQLEEELQKKYSAQLAIQRDEYRRREEQLSQEKELFEEKKRRENELFQERFEAKIREERTMIEQRLKSQLNAEQAEQFSLLQKELNEKSEQVKDLHASKAEIERLRREKEELKSAAEAEAQAKLNAQLAEEKTRLNRQLAEEADRIRKAEEERNEMRFRELNKQLEDQKRLTEEMKRKQEQGSMQLQGEVQELAIEEWLTAQFPLDTIEEIKKGARGGDCVHIVHTRERQNCGSIYYESKRTKDFQPAWIAKFKSDMREKGADIGVLVTDTMPGGMERMGLRDGVWICRYDEFKGLCAVLRETIVRLNNSLVSQENRGDKMHMLYDFLTSNTFRMQVEAIVEGFTQMRQELEKEKRSMNLAWKRREVLIEKVLINTTDMYGSVKGIAGSAVQEVKALELEDEAQFDTI